MKVTVIGKEHASGKSKKTGKDFDNTIAHVTHKKNGAEGLAADSIWLDTAAYPLSSIIVGKVYDLDRDSRGYVVDFTLAQ